MHDTDNYTLGKGIINFNLLKDGAYQGYRDMGNAPSLSVSIALDILEHFSSRGGMKSKDKKIVQTATPKVSFTLDEVNIENFELLFLGDAESVVQAFSYGQALSLAVKQLDRYYMDTTNGKRMILPPTYLKYDGGSVIFEVGEVVTGAGGASAEVLAVIGDATEGILVLGPVTSGPFINNEALSGDGSGAATADGAEVAMAVGDALVCNSAGTTIYTLDTDYTIDTNVGRVFVLSTGSIAEDSTIYFAFGCEKCTYTRVNMVGNAELEGEFHFISDNPVGKNYELLFWRVSLTPSGDTAFIGEGWSTMTMEGEILKDETGHPDEPYGWVIEEPTIVATTTT